MNKQIIKFDIQPEQVNAFKSALIAVKKEAVQESGCLEIKIFQDNKQPNIFFEYSRYQDQAAPTDQVFSFSDLPLLNNHHNALNSSA